MKRLRPSSPLFKCILLIVIGVSFCLGAKSQLGILYGHPIRIASASSNYTMKLTSSALTDHCDGFATNAYCVASSKDYANTWILQSASGKPKGSPVMSRDQVQLVVLETGFHYSGFLYFCDNVWAGSPGIKYFAQVDAKSEYAMTFTILNGMEGGPVLDGKDVRLLAVMSPQGYLGTGGPDPNSENVSVGLIPVSANAGNTNSWKLSYVYAAAPTPAPAPAPTPAPSPTATTTTVITTTTQQVVPSAPAPVVNVNELNPSTKQAQIHNAVQNQDVNGVRTLLQQGADPNLVEGNQGRTPMHIATTKGDASMIQVLKTAGANINAKDNNGKTPLDIALESNDNATARILLNNGASAAAATAGTDRVIERRDGDMMRLLLQNGANGNAVASKCIATDNVEILSVTLQSGTRATNDMFNEAARQKSSKCANELLRNGVNKGQAMDQVIATNDMQMVDLILLSGVDVPTANKALVYAIQQRDMRMAAVAVERNYADPNAGMPVAVETSNIQAVEFLLTKRADANDQMDEAAAGGKNDIVNAFLRAGGTANLGVQAAAQNDRVSTLQILLDAGGDANLAMPSAIDHGSLAMVNMCLSARNRADVSRTEYVVKTCEKSNRDILGVLLNAGAKPDPGMPICIANKNAGMVDLLIKAGAAVTRPDYMTKACENKDAPVVKLLLDAGADANPGMPIAVDLGDANIVAMLIAKGATATNPQYMENASGKGFANIVSQLIKAGGDPNAGMNAAVNKFKMEVLTVLLAAGADGSKDIYMTSSVKHNSPDLTGALITAGGKPQVAIEPAVACNADRVVSLLKDKGVDITPVAYLVTSVTSNHTATAKVLVLAGASAKDYWDESKGKGLLHMTIESYMNPEMVVLLVQAGADVNRKETSNGNSPLHTVADHAKDNKEHMEKAATIIKALIAAKADVNAVNNKGQTVLKACPDRPILQKPLKEAGAVNKLK